MIKALGVLEPGSDSFVALPPGLRQLLDGPGSSEDGSLSDLSFQTDESDRPALDSAEGQLSLGPGARGSGPGRRDENHHSLGGTPRRGLAAKLQQLLSPAKRPSLRHTASVEQPSTRRDAGSLRRDAGSLRRASEQTEPPPRKSPVESLLHPHERPDSTASEVGAGTRLPLLPGGGWTGGTLPHSRWARPVGRTPPHPALGLRVLHSWNWQGPGAPA